MKTFPLLSDFAFNTSYEYGSVNLQVRDATLNFLTLSFEESTPLIALTFLVIRYLDTIPSESNSDSETKQYDIYNSRNQHKKWGVKSWFDSLWN